MEPQKDATARILRREDKEPRDLLSGEGPGTIPRRYLYGYVARYYTLLLFVGFWVPVKALPLWIRRSVGVWDMPFFPLLGLRGSYSGLFFRDASLGRFLGYFLFALFRFKRIPVREPLHPKPQTPNPKPQTPNPKP